MKPSYHWETAERELSSEQLIRNAIVDFVNSHENFTTSQVTQWLMVNGYNVTYKDHYKGYIVVNNFLHTLKSRKNIISIRVGKYIRITKI